MSHPTGVDGPDDGGPPRPVTWPSAVTRPVVLLGWPVAHSRSPAMHNAAFAALDEDLVYLALPTPPDRLVDVVAALGAVGAVGANVTVPHKVAVAGCCDVRTAEAELVGAVNTLHWTDGRLLGDNTDAVGLATAVDEAGATDAGAAWTVLGTGGSARAVAVAAGRGGHPVTVVGRRREAVEAVVDVARRAGAPTAAGIDVGDEVAVRRAVDASRTVLNATPLGMDDEALPRPFHALAIGQDAYDLVYRPAPGAAPTPFLAAAVAAGAGAHDGLGMLVAQAAASSARWTGRPAPRDVMRAALGA